VPPGRTWRARCQGFQKLWRHHHIRKYQECRGEVEIGRRVFDAVFEFQINHVRFREEASNVGYDEKTPREMPELDSQETRILIEPGDLAKTQHTHATNL